MNEPALTINELSKNFDGHVALDHASMQVPRGSIYGFIGQNGAGKSTTLKTVMGLIKADRGEVNVLGENAWGLPVATKAKIAYVPEVSFHFSWLSIEGMMDYVGQFYPHWNKKQALDLLDAIHLDPNKSIKSLSLGQTRSVSIIIGLACNAELLILDEPSGNLDVVARRLFQQVLLDYARAGDKTIVLSSHVLTDLERVVDHVGIIHRGKMLVEDELDNLKENLRYLHLIYSASPPEHFDIPGIVHIERFNNEARLAVANLTSEELNQYRCTQNAQIDIQPMSLEEIFVAYATGQAA